MTTPFELVVFDMAGTTVVDDGLVEAAFGRAWDAVVATAEGRDAAMEHVRATMGQSKIDVFRGLGDEDTAQAMNAAFEGAFRALIEEGRNHLLLGAAIEVGCPVRILQGAQDPDVPWRHAFALAERLPAEDVVLTMIQDGDHRLSRPQDIARIMAAVAEIG